jgi:hypothetical protein
MQKNSANSSGALLTTSSQKCEMARPQRGRVSACGLAIVVAALRSRRQNPVGRGHRR